MLEGRIERDGRVLTSHVALNDVVVNHGGPSRMIEIDVTIDGQPVCQVKADGVILASATGSTAYNLSAGGPIVHPAVDAFVLTPIAPHTLTQRPLVLPATAIDHAADGQPPHRRSRRRPSRRSTVSTRASRSRGGDLAIRVRRAAPALRLLRTSSRTHFDMLRDKLKWGDLPEVRTRTRALP